MYADARRRAETMSGEELLAAEDVAERRRSYEAANGNPWTAWECEERRNAYRDAITERKANGVWDWQGRLTRHV